MADRFDLQVRQAFENVEATLARVGGTLKDSVWISVAISHDRVLTDIRREIYGGDYPASTLLTTSSFAHSDFMVEITPIADLPA